ncbi:hypothetical protein, partial [Streptomyces decoyicus]|uniref:hypothetical protein n=1 Tax=Streptomyces decoyicus TaxID=249567 RepID=UPI0033A9587C
PCARRGLRRSRERARLASRSGRPAAELLGQSDDDAADVTEPIGVLVLLQLADEFGAVGAQAGNDSRVPLRRQARRQLPALLG